MKKDHLLQCSTPNVSTNYSKQLDHALAKTEINVRKRPYCHIQFIEIFRIGYKLVNAPGIQ